MRSDAHAEHRAVHSHQHGGHPPAAPKKRRRLALRATLHGLAVCEVGGSPSKKCQVRSKSAQGSLRQIARIKQKKPLTFRAWHQ